MYFLPEHLEQGNFEYLSHARTRAAELAFFAAERAADPAGVESVTVAYATDYQSPAEPVAYVQPTLDEDGMPVAPESLYL